jgi:hypothetical protein
MLSHLMDGDAVLIAHLVKLVDADHSAIREDHGPSLQTLLTWRWDKREVTV